MLEGTLSQRYIFRDRSYIWLNESFYLSEWALEYERFHGERLCKQFHREEGDQAMQTCAGNLGVNILEIFQCAASLVPQHSVKIFKIFQRAPWQTKAFSHSSAPCTFQTISWSYSLPKRVLFLQNLSQCPYKTTKRHKKTALRPKTRIWTGMKSKMRNKWDVVQNKKLWENMPAQFSFTTTWYYKGWKYAQLSPFKHLQWQRCW